MWQVLTGDSWASGGGMGRHIIYYGEDGSGMPLAAIFFITYIFVASIIMSNVVIAILLEGYLKCSNELKAEKEKEKEKEKNKDKEKKDKKESLSPKEVEMGEVKKLPEDKPEPKLNDSG